MFHEIIRNKSGSRQFGPSFLLFPSIILQLIFYLSIIYQKIYLCLKYIQGLSSKNFVGSEIWKNSSIWVKNLLIRMFVTYCVTDSFSMIQLGEIPPLYPLHQEFRVLHWDRLSFSWCQETISSVYMNSPPMATLRLSIPWRENKCHQSDIHKYINFI